MTHPTREEWMEYLYNELDQKKRSALTSHLRGCSECQSEISGWRDVMRELDNWRLPQERKFRTPRARLIRWAAAAVLMIAAVYTISILSAPAYDMEQLRQQLSMELKTSLESDLREELAGDLMKVLVAHQDQFEQEFYRQYRADLSQFALGTLTASGAETNRRLTELTKAIHAYQLQERRLITTFLEDIEQKRFQENAKLRGELAMLAVETEDELVRTRRDFADLLVHAGLNYQFPPTEQIENLNQSNERSSQ